MSNRNTCHFKALINIRQLLAFCLNKRLLNIILQRSPYKYDLILQRGKSVYFIIIPIYYVTSTNYHMIGRAQKRAHDDIATVLTMRLDTADTHTHQPLTLASPKQCSTAGDPLNICPPTPDAVLASTIARARATLMAGS